MQWRRAASPRLLASAAVAVLSLLPTAVEAQRTTSANVTPPGRSAVEPSSTGADASTIVVLGVESELWFDGTSNVRDFTCRAQAFKVDTELRPGVDPLALETLERGFRDVVLRVPARQLECGNGVMNTHMWRALRVDTYPQITYELSSYGVTHGGASSVTLELSGDLTIAGVTRRQVITAEGVLQADGSLRVSGRSGLAMTDFGVDPPTVLLGVFRVRPPVVVGFDLTFRVQE